MFDALFNTGLRLSHFGNVNQPKPEAHSDIPRGTMVVAYDWDDYDKTRPFLFKLNDYTWYQGKTVFHLECVSTKKYPGTNGWTVTKYRSEITPQDQFESRKKQKTLSKKKPAPKKAEKAPKAAKKASTLKTTKRAPDKDSFDLDDWMADYKAKAARLDQTIAEVVDIAVERVEDVIDLPKVIGALINAYEDCRSPGEDRSKRGERLTEQPLNVCEQAVRWSLEHYIALRLPKLVPIVDEVYERLQKDKHDEKNSFEFNDCDNDAFIVEAGDKKVFVLKTQSRRYLFIRDGKELHVRRIWDSYEEPEKDDDWQKKQDDLFKNGIRHAIRHAESLVERYSDNLEGNDYVHRPDLAFYKKAKFEPRYKDFRDPGYAVSYREPYSDGMPSPFRAEITTHDFGVFENAFFYLLCTVETLREEQASRKK